MLEHKRTALCLGGLLAMLGLGCIDNPEDPRGPDQGRQCTWDMLDADTGEIIERWTYAFSTRGNMIWQQVDYRGTGEIDFRIDYYFDDAGLLQREEIDENGDGVSDRAIAYHYNSRSLRVLIEEANRNGRTDLRRHFSYDARDKLLTRDDDYEADGEINSRTTWSYDPDDNPVRVELDHGLDGAANQIVAQDFELIAGTFRLVLRRGDWNGNGSWDYSHRHFWNENGLLIGREIDETGDGNINERWRYGYDSNGNRISGEGDTNGDGNWDVRQSYSTDCWVWPEPDR